MFEFTETKNGVCVISTKKLTTVSGHPFVMVIIGSSLCEKLFFNPERLKIPTNENALDCWNWHLAVGFDEKERSLHIVCPDEIVARIIFGHNGLKNLKLPQDLPWKISLSEASLIKVAKFYQLKTIEEIIMQQCIDCNTPII